MDWKKFLSREFLVSLALLVVAAFALFFDKCGFVEWAAACGGFVAIWSTNLTVQKIKAPQ